MIVGRLDRRWALEDPGVSPAGGSLEPSVVSFAYTRRPLAVQTGLRAVYEVLFC